LRWTSKAASFGELSDHESRDGAHPGREVGARFELRGLLCNGEEDLLKDIVGGVQVGEQADQEAADRADVPQELLLHMHRAPDGRIAHEPHCGPQ